MSIIRVSGSRPGKINRVYGSSNYVQSQSKKKIPTNTERIYYTNVIGAAKQFVQSKNTQKYIKVTQKHGNRLQEKTLVKILNAYKDTILIGKKLSKNEKKKQITNNLEKNLLKHGVSKSTTLKILKYDPSYKKTVQRKNSSKRKQNNKDKHKTKQVELYDYNTSYFNRIIYHSYKNLNDNEINDFIKKLNRRKKLLSDAVVKNIIIAYKTTLHNKKKKKQKRKAIKHTLEKNLIWYGVHPDVIKKILEHDINYKS